MNPTAQAARAGVQHVRGVECPLLACSPFDLCFLQQMHRRLIQDLLLLLVLLWDEEARSQPHLQAVVVC